MGRIVKLTVAGAIMCCAAIFVVTATTEKISLSTPISSKENDSLKKKPSATLGASTNDNYEFPSLRRLIAASSDIEARGFVRGARRELRRWKDGAVAAQAVVDVLRTGFDMPMQQPFRVGRGGYLRSFPSVRLALLDILPSLDGEIARAYSMELLSTSQSPDEWALALRNYAWTTDEAATDEFFRSKVDQMLMNDSWRREPTSGFLEAFDLVAFSQSGELLSRLVHFSETDPSIAVRRAAKLAIAKFTEFDATRAMEVMAQVERDRPMSRARLDTMARADLSDPKDREILRSYLLSSTVADEELAQFAQRFPQASQVGGYFLVTDFNPTPFVELARRDRGALQVLNRWIDDPSLAARRELLLLMRERLERFCASSSKGGYL